MKYLYTILLIDIALLCWANGEEVPPLPPHDPTPQQVLEGHLFPPREPIIYGEWLNGEIYQLTNSEFKIRFQSVWYDVYSCDDLAKGNWKRVARLDTEDATSDRLGFLHNNPSGFYRAIRVGKPHPPRRREVFGSDSHPTTNRPTGGGFR